MIIARGCWEARACFVFIWAQFSLLIPIFYPTFIRFIFLVGVCYKIYEKKAKSKL